MFRMHDKPSNNPLITISIVLKNDITIESTLFTLNSWKKLYKFPGIPLLYPVAASHSIVLTLPINHNNHSR